MRFGLWCRHDWKVRQVTYQRKWAFLTDRNPPTRLDLGDCTQVLQLCTRCGDPRTRELRGIWTLEDLKRAPTDQEIAKTLGVKL